MLLYELSYGDLFQDRDGLYRVLKFDSEGSAIIANKIASINGSRLAARCGEDTVSYNCYAGVILDGGIYKVVGSLAALRGSND